MLGPPGGARLSSLGSRVAWRVGVPAAAALGGIAGGGAILSWGLVTPFLVVVPIAVGSCALVAALGAGWADTFLAPDGSRGRLLWIVGAAEAAAVIVAVAFLVVPVSVGFRFLGGVAAISAAASWAAWRFRGRKERAGWRVGATLGLAAAVLVLELLSLNGDLRYFFVGWSGIIAGALAGVAGMVAGAVLFMRSHGDPRRSLEKDAAATLALAGLPAPVFFGAYYVAFLLGVTSG